MKWIFVWIEHFKVLLFDFVISGSERWFIYRVGSASFNCTKQRHTFLSCSFRRQHPVFTNAHNRRLCVATPIDFEDSQESTLCETIYFSHILHSECVIGFTHLFSVSLSIRSIYTQNTHTLSLVPIRNIVVTYWMRWRKRKRNDVSMDKMYTIFTFDANSSHSSVRNRIPLRLLEMGNWKIFSRSLDTAHRRHTHPLNAEIVCTKSYSIYLIVSAPTKPNKMIIYLFIYLFASVFSPLVVHFSTNETDSLVCQRMLLICNCTNASVALYFVVNYFIFPSTQY